jgi:hypothetical protein
MMGWRAHFFYGNQMQNPPYSVENAYKKVKTTPLSWRQRNRLNLQMVALGMGVLALFALLFCMQNDQTLIMGIGFAMLVVVFNITAWME